MDKISELLVFSVALFQRDWAESIVYIPLVTVALLLPVAIIYRIIASLLSPLVKKEDSSDVISNPWLNDLATIGLIMVCTLGTYFANKAFS